MKCKICGKKAIIFLRQHNLALCEEHFIERFERETEKTIKKFRMFKKDTPIVVAVSGGKDSLAVFLTVKKLGYNVRGLFLKLGLRRGDFDYSAYSEEKVLNFAQKFGVEIKIFDLKEETGYTVPELARKRRDMRVCRVCGMIKRYYLNKVAYEMGAKVIVTGHNLDDEVATLLGNILRFDHEYLYRQAPFLESTHPKLLARAKPFAFFTERETALYAYLHGIEFTEKSCPFSKGAKSTLYKHVLNQIEEESPGTKLRFYREFLNFRDRFLKPFIKPVQLRECRICGMPTTLEVCAVCRLLGRSVTSKL